MAEIILRATPDMLEERKQHLRTESQMLQDHARKLREGLALLNTMIVSPELVDITHKTEAQIQSCEALSRDLDDVFAYIDKMSAVYDAAQERFIAELKADLEARQSAVSSG